MAVKSEMVPLEWALLLRGRGRLNFEDHPTSTMTSEPSQAKYFQSCLVSQHSYVQQRKLFHVRSLVTTSSGLLLSLLSLKGLHSALSLILSTCDRGV